LVLQWEPALPAIFYLKVKQIAGKAGSHSKAGSHPVYSIVMVPNIDYI